MRSAGNFHPEWGYLAPAPSFMRTARLALVATAVGATAAAVVVVSLLDRPGSADDNASIAMHALVTSAPVAPVVATASPVLNPVANEFGKPPVAITSVPASGPAQPAIAAAPIPAPASARAPSALAGASRVGASRPINVAASPAPLAASASIAALNDTPPTAAAPALERPDIAVAPEEEPAKKFANKKRRPYDAVRRWQAAGDARKRWRNNRGFAPLFRLFSFRTGSSSYPN
jgi:hypothetical protein